MDITYRPIQQWPGSLTRARRTSPFSAPWGKTMQLLEAELAHLQARRVVLQIALSEADFRLDGKPRARAIASHPGVILAFESKHGPLQYAVDTYLSFQDNVRAIALALEALRKVDRYGVTRNAEQYKGWRQLPAAGETGSLLELREELFRIAGRPTLTRAGDDRELVRLALQAAHPDTGGDAETFQKVLAAKRRLEGAAP